MSAAQIYQDPQKLTVLQLKEELKKHGVSFPKSARKAEYVGLYRDRVQNNSGFSSDEDIIDIMSTETHPGGLEVRLEKMIETDELDNNANRDVPPARRSPRRPKRRHRLIEQDDFGQSFGTSGGERNEVQQGEVKATDEDIERARSTEVRVRLQKLDNSMTISGTDIRELSDDELRMQLRKRGFNIGPIMKTTRSVYEKKLERALKNAESGDAGIEYSDQDSRSEEEEEEEEEEEPEPVVMETRRTRRSMLQRDEKGDSATRRRGMQTRDEAIQHDAPEKKETPRTPPPQPAPTPQETLRPARRWLPVWMQILIVVFIALLVYLVAKTMEENPQKMIPRA